MPDVEIAGSNTVLSFPDSMSQQEIGRVLAAHPTVRKIRASAMKATKNGDPYGDPAITGEKTRTEPGVAKKTVWKSQYSLENSLTDQGFSRAEVPSVVKKSREIGFSQVLAERKANKVRSATDALSGDIAERMRLQLQTTQGLGGLPPDPTKVANAKALRNRGAIQQSVLDKERGLPVKPTGNVLRDLVPFYDAAMADPNRKDSFLEGFANRGAQIADYQSLAMLLGAPLAGEMLGAKAAEMLGKAFLAQGVVGAGQNLADREAWAKNPQGQAGALVSDLLMMAPDAARMGLKAKAKRAGNREQGTGNRTPRTPNDPARIANPDGVLNYNSSAPVAERGDVRVYAPKRKPVNRLPKQGVALPETGKRPARVMNPTSEGTGAESLPSSPMAPSMEAASPVGVKRVRVADVNVDPERFQFKQNVDALGVEKRLSGPWDEDSGGVVHLWRDPQTGKDFVVNGHHRYDLAVREGVSEMNARYIEAPDAATARYAGAKININEGQGTALDAARVMREKGLTPEQAQAQGIQLSRKLGADGMALSRLDDGLFRQVEVGTLPEARAIAISKATENAAEQRGVMGLIAAAEKRGKKVSDSQIEDLAIEARRAPTVRENAENLFGDEGAFDTNLAVEKAELATWVRGELASEKRTFGSLTSAKKAQTLERGQNVINPAENARIAGEAAARVEQFAQARKLNQPQIDAALNDAAIAQSKGEKPNVVRERLLNTVTRTLAETDAGGTEVLFRGSGQSDGVRSGVAGGAEGSAGARTAGGGEPQNAADNTAQPESGAGDAVAANADQAPGVAASPQTRTVRLSQDEAFVLANQFREGHALRAKLDAPFEGEKPPTKADFDLTDAEAAQLVEALGKSDPVGLNATALKKRLEGRTAAQRTTIKGKKLGAQTGAVNLFGPSAPGSPSAKLKGMISAARSTKAERAALKRNEKPEDSPSTSFFNAFRTTLSKVDAFGDTIGLPGTMEKHTTRTGNRAEGMAVNARFVESERRREELQLKFGQPIEAIRKLVREADSGPGVSKAQKDKDFIDLIQRPFNDPVRQNVTGKMKQALEAHDKLTAEMKQYLYDSMKRVGAEPRDANGNVIPLDKWGITDRGFYHHLFLGKIRLYEIDPATGKRTEIHNSGPEQGFFNNYAEAQARVNELLKTNPNAKFEAEGTDLSYDPTLRVSTGKYFQSVKEIKDSVGQQGVTLSNAEIMEDLRGVIGTKGNKAKFLGTLSKRKGADGYSLNYDETMRRYVAGSIRARELTELQHDLYRPGGLVEKLLDKGETDRANDVEAMMKALWGTPTELDKFTKFRARQAAVALGRVNNFLKLDYNISSSVANLLDPLKTLFPETDISTREFAGLYADYLKPQTRKRLRDAGVLQGSSKIDPSGTMGMEKERTTPFRAASEVNRAIGYLAGEMLAEKKAKARGITLTPEMKHQNGLAWAMQTEFGNNDYWKAPVLRGPGGAIFGQYKGYTMKMMENMVGLAQSRPSDKKIGRINASKAKRLGKFTAGVVVPGGVKATGVIGKSVAGLAAAKLAISWLQSLGLRQDDAENLVNYGVFGVAGVDMSQKTGVLEEPRGKDVVEKAQNFFTPPSIGLIAAPFRALTGDVTGAIDSVTGYRKQAVNAAALLSGKPGTAKAKNRTMSLNRYETGIHALGGTSLSASKARN